MTLKSMVQIVGITKDIDANLAEKPFRLTKLIVPVRPGIKEQIVDLAMNNASIRDTARALHISINGHVFNMLMRT